MLLHILYLVGITAEAMTGALAAGRRRMDTFGVIIIKRADHPDSGDIVQILDNTLLCKWQITSAQLFIDAGRTFYT